MAYAPIAFIVPEYDKSKFKNWWLKAYQPGTTTAIALSYDSAGATLASRIELNSEGFPVTAGGDIFIPHIDDTYDLWLFPTSAEADSNDTTNATQLADNISAATPTTDLTLKTNTESVTLTSGQVSVTFSNSVTDAAFYINGPDSDNGRLDKNNDMTVDAVTNTIVLTQSYPAGTVITLAYNDVADFAPADDLLYGTVALMVASSQVAGLTIRTKGYTTAGDGGAGTYLVKSAAQAATDGDTIDGIGAGFTLANGNVAVLQPTNGGYNAKQWGAVGDRVTDDHAALQAYINFCQSISKVDIFLPDGDDSVYAISQPLDVGVTTDGSNGRTVSFQGPLSARGGVGLLALPNFSGFSMIRNWSDSMYVGAESRNGPPADMTAYSADITRYVNVHNVYFLIDDTQVNPITCVDLVAAQESCNLSKCVFDGGTAVKGQPIRIKTVTGTEISINGVKFQDIVVYGSNWDREMYVEAQGVDLDIDNWVTSPSAHTSSPFFIDAIDVTFRNLHSEAYSTGNPTFDFEGTDLRVDQSLVVVRDGQGDIFQCTNPFGTGFDRSGVSLKDLFLYPVGGSWTNVTNRDSINIVNDTSQSPSLVMPLQLKDYAGTNSASLPSLVYELDRHWYRFTDGSGNEYHRPTKTVQQVKVLPTAAAEFSSASPYTIPYSVDNTIAQRHGAMGYITGANGTTNQPFSILVTFFSSGFGTPAMEIIHASASAPAGLAATVSGNQPQLTTTDTNTAFGMRCTLFGNIRIEAIPDLKE